jgi:hypothetical protein
MQEGEDNFDKLLYRVKPPANLNDLITSQTSKELTDLVVDIANG